MIEFHIDIREHRIFLSFVYRYILSSNHNRPLGILGKEQTTKAGVNKQLRTKKETRFNNYI